MLTNLKTRNEYLYTFLYIYARRMCPCLLVTYFFFETKGAKIITWFVNIYDVARLM